MVELLTRAPKGHEAQLAAELDSLLDLDALPDLGMIFALAVDMTDTLFQPPVPSRPLDLPLQAQQERILRIMAHQVSQIGVQPQKDSPDGNGDQDHPAAGRDVGHSDPGADRALDGSIQSSLSFAHNHLGMPRHGLR